LIWFREPNDVFVPVLFGVAPVEFALLGWASAKNRHSELGDSKAHGYGAKKAAPLSVDSLGNFACAQSRIPLIQLVFVHLMSPMMFRRPLKPSPIKGHF
jgi:hypothetical protein